MLGGVYITGGKADMPTEATVRATGIMITILPVLLIYPFTKKFFTKGMTLGAIKG
jgi:putative aldouronate transport system permease protein